jgi:hypothetical protein
MAEGTGTSVGIISLDLRIVSKLNEQLNAIAASANKSAQQSFQSVGKTVEQSISKPVENAGKAMEKAITAPLEKASSAAKAPLKAVTDQFDQTADEIGDIAARAAKRWNESISNPGGKLPDTAKLDSHSGLATDPAEYMKNYNANLKPKAGEKPVSSVAAAESATSAVQTAQTSGNAFTRMADRIKSAFSSVNQSAQKTYADVTAGAQKAAVKSEQAAQQSAKAVESSEKRKRSASQGTLRTQTNAMLSAVTSNAQGIAKVGVMGRALSSNLLGSLSFAIPLALAAAAFKTLQKGFTLASVNSNQFKKSLNEVKANLEIAFTPIYQAILPALNTLMSWLAAATKQVAVFVSALFGKTYAQSVAATKKMQANAAAAKKASSGGSKSQNDRTVASFDKLNIIGKKDSGSDGTDGIKYDALNTKGTVAATSLANKFKAAWAGIAAGFNDYVMQPIKDNISKFDQPVAKFKALFSDIGAQCQMWMKPLSDWFKNDFKNALNIGISNTMTIWAGFADTVAMVASTVWKAWKPVIDWFVKDGLPMLTQMWVECSNTGVTAFEAVKTVFGTLWHGVIDPFSQFVSKVIVDTLNTFKRLWDQYGATTFENIRTTINTIKDTFLNIWKSYLKPVFDQLFLTLNQLWTDHLQPLVAQIGVFVAKLVNGAMEIFNGFIAPLVNWFIKTWGPPIAQSINDVIKTLGTIVGVVADVAKGLFKSLGGVVDFVTGVFTGNWSKAWHGVSDVFKGIFEGLLAIAKVPLNGIIGLINGVISGINNLIKGLNSLNIDIPKTKWTDAMTLGFSIPSIPSIPKLANGGILTQPTLAMMGEYSGAKSNPEIAAPQSLMYDTMVQANGEMVTAMSSMMKQIIQAIKDSGNSGDIYLDGEKIAKAVTRYINDTIRRTGKSPILT